MASRTASGKRLLNGDDFDTKQSHKKSTIPTALWVMLSVVLVVVVVAAVLALVGMIFSIKNSHMSVATASVPGGTAVVQSTGTAKRTCPANITPANAWHHWGRDSSNTRAAIASGINSNNVAGLVHQWDFTMRAGSSGGPACDPQYCYIADDAGWIYKINSSSGALVWNVSLSAISHRPDSRTRNMPIVYQDRILIGDRAFGSGRVYALKTLDGSLIWTNVIETHFATTLTMSGTPACGMWIVGTSSLEELASQNPLYPCCSFRGSIVAIDIASGQIVWKTYTLPDNVPGYSGAAVWGSAPSVDYTRRQVYVGTGNLYTSPPDVDACVQQALANQTSIEPCFGGLFNQIHHNSILALDLDTGAIKWSRPLGGYDVWTIACTLRDFLGIPTPNCPPISGPDFDFGQAPIMYRTSSGVDVVVAGQKSGATWALNADTGIVVWANISGIGSSGGGFMFGSAVDSTRFYGLETNAYMKYWNDTTTGTTQCGSYIVAQDRNTGRVLWKSPIVTQPPQTDCAFVAATNFAVYAATHLLPYNPNGVTTWVQSGAISAVSASNPDQSVVFAGDTRGVVFALSGKTGQLLWQYTIPASGTFSNVVISGTQIFVAAGVETSIVSAPGNQLVSFGLP